MPSISGSSWYLAYMNKQWGWVTAKERLDDDKSGHLEPRLPCGLSSVVTVLPASLSSTDRAWAADAYK